MKVSKILLCCFSLIMIFSSCNIQDEGGASGGILVNSDVLASIKQEAADRENSSLASSTDVFWTPSGSIWHKSYDCSFLANSKTIYHGSVDEAKLEGKERECSRCFLTDEDKLYAELEDNTIEHGDVFFIREENIWHTDINCSSILGADKVYNASIEEALELGKEMPCDKCGK